MNGSTMRLVRALALLVGGCLSVFIIYLGYQAMLMSKASQLPRLSIQGLGLFAIGGACLLGVAVSAFAPRVLEESLWLRKGFICVAFVLPAIDFFALWNNGQIALAIGGHTLVSLIVSSLIALAIATA